MGYLLTHMQKYAQDGSMTHTHVHSHIRTETCGALHTTPLKQVLDETLTEAHEMMLRLADWKIKDDPRFVVESVYSNNKSLSQVSIYNSETGTRKTFAVWTCECGEVH